MTTNSLGVRVSCEIQQTAVTATDSSRSGCLQLGAAGQDRQMVDAGGCSVCEGDSPYSGRQNLQAATTQAVQGLQVSLQQALSYYLNPCELQVPAVSKPAPGALCMCIRHQVAARVWLVDFGFGVVMFVGVVRMFWHATG